MTPILFLASWAIRSSVLISIGSILLWALRVKSPSVRLAAWIAMLFGSLAIPLLGAALPSLPFPMVRATARSAAPPPPAIAMAEAPKAFAPAPSGPSIQPRAHTAGFGWGAAAAILYLLVALGLAIRLCFGIALGLRLLRSSRATGAASDGIEIRESGGVRSPMTLGIARPAIVLPVGWRDWSAAKRDAVLAHERSHIRRFDPAVQLLSAIHRAFLWHSPLSWFLHQRIVRAAEEVSDDAALAVAPDRALYAEVLLGFMRTGGRKLDWIGTPMARYMRAEKRIDRILDESATSGGVTRWTAAALIAIAAPLAYVAAAASPHGPLAQQAAPARAAAQAQSAPAARTPGPPAPPSGQSNSPSARGANQASAAGYISALGNVAPLNTVAIKPRIDGQLESVEFQEGGMVKANQEVARVGSGSIMNEIELTERQMARDGSALNEARIELERAQKAATQTSLEAGVNAAKQAVAQLQAKLDEEQAVVSRLQVRMNDTRLYSPFAGMAGLRQVDPGNMVHADATTIVTITQIDPIAVVFQIPEDGLPQIRSRLLGGESVPVEAWNRDASAKIATGRLTAIDNQIDSSTGTIKMKAEFDNKTGALFPNQFVNVRVLVNSR